MHVYYLLRSLATISSLQHRYHVVNAQVESRFVMKTTVTADIRGTKAALEYSGQRCQRRDRRGVARAFSPCLHVNITVGCGYALARSHNESQIVKKGMYAMQTEQNIHKTFVSFPNIPKPTNKTFVTAQKN